MNADNALLWIVVVFWGVGLLFRAGTFVGFKMLHEQLKEQALDTRAVIAYLATSATNAGEAPVVAQPDQSLTDREKAINAIFERYNIKK